ncbi:MAG: MinD/ParA family protein [Nitrospirae bacterium]|nr:MinD/ParA family protein [Nitrospirota bacterium]
MHLPRVISITSGKGGVGKTNVSANMAYIMATRFGLRVLVLDADLGLGNMDVLFNIRAAHTLQDVLMGNRSLSEITVRGPGGIQILPAASGVEEMTSLNSDQKLRLLEEFENLSADLDILLIDTGAGISENVLTFNLASRETVVVVTPEPTSRTDAFALMKVLFRRQPDKPFLFLANMVRDRQEGVALFDLVSRVADSYLPGLALSFAGHLPADPSLIQAVRAQKAIAEMLPGAPFSKGMEGIVRSLLARPPRSGGEGGIGLWMKRLAGSGSGPA